MTLLRRAEKQGRKFQNPVPTEVGGLSTVFKVLPLYHAESSRNRPKTRPGPFKTDPSVYAAAPGSGLRITWFGHSTLLIEIDGMRVLVDPVWEERASPVQWAGPRRFFAPPLSLAELPPLNAVLITHDHYDHLGANTIRHLAKLPASSNARGSPH